MEPEAIEQAYITFVRELRDGGFERPEQGWAAEHIAAHVAINNDHFTSAVRDLLATGEASYDNERAVDIEQLTAYASAFDNLGDLADDVARSATDLAVAYGDLETADAETEFPIVIHHEGRIVRDGPGPIGELIEGNASYHLSMHLDQLLALRPSR
jgi:Mycothiol maleylpyruvate isomerase N-terminal domain